MSARELACMPSNTPRVYSPIPYIGTNDDELHAQSRCRRGRRRSEYRHVTVVIDRLPL